MSLVLGRSVGQALIFYQPGTPPITVKVCSIDNRGVVRMTIDAPRNVNVVRDELLVEMGDRTTRRGGGKDAYYEEQK
jgi:sRNA-binding carbon storage regulator CsrA